MNHALILQPMIATMLLTLAVWVYLYARRLPAMQKLKLPAQTYTTPDKAREFLPEAVSYPANNLMNLFELPVLYYALCLVLLVTQTVDTVYLAAAWGFFAFRLLHSAIHCTVNRVLPRFLCYLASSLLLWLMLLRTAAQVLAPG